MIYLYATYGVALAGAVCLIFRNRKPGAAADGVRMTSGKSRRMSAALSRWMIESAVELPRPELPLALPPAASPEPEMLDAEFEAPAEVAVAEECPSGAAPEEPAGAESESYAWQDNYTTYHCAETNYYEILQISPHADMETIHRVYRILASRFHPDNPRTGNVERFYELSKAFEVLSNSAKRRAYDASYHRMEEEPAQIFRVEDFVDGVKGEENRRLGVLSLLYNRRRYREDSPGLSLLELERRMAVPREYLHFTIWYLRSKDYIRALEQNSDLALTANGVDYVEQHCSTNRVIRELLTAGKDEREAA